MTRRGFIIVRDRMANLPALVEWIGRGGYQPTIIDNASSFPPLLAYLATKPCDVVRLHFNHGQRAPWTAHVVQRLAGNDHYLVTDPDIEPPTDVSASDVVGHWEDLLERYPDIVKVGAALRIDDLPDEYPHAAAVRQWEADHWRAEREAGVYEAPIDTTLALWRGNSEYCFGPALRTGDAYAARHLDWYVDAASANEELAYYRAHTRRGVSHWVHDRLTEDKLAVLEARPYRRLWRLREGLRRRTVDLAARLDRRWRV